MKRIYEKSELAFAIVWIVIYCVLQSLANPLNEKIGIDYSASAVLCILQAAFLFAFIRRNGLMKRYGLCKTAVSAHHFLYYIPLVILATENLWNGVAINYSPMGIICRIVMMLCVGFVEELIFRGFLFKAMEKDGVKSAIIVSSVTFGIGHLVNLFNGSGIDLINNFCQIILAVAVGFLLVIIFHRGGSLLPCVFTHAALNTLNTFANETGQTAEKQIFHCLILVVITIAYTLILIKTLPKRKT